ncbi:MAG: RNA pseudouridine synthase [Treponema sp.]|nr:RNA pseudouridine synthase [Treponema sp.]
MEPTEKPYAIIFEDEELLVADKLAPIPVQVEKSGDRPLQDMLRDELRERGAPDFLEAAHRIDRRASGAVLFARTPKSLSTLEAAFRDHRIDKTYLACVEREPEPNQGRLEHRLVWDKRRNVVRALAAEGPSKERGEGGKPVAAEQAVLEYRLVGRSERYFFVEVSLITGRHHQIRAQFSAAGFPIRGDLKYGARRSARNGLIMLHARRLGFAQPRSGERIEVLAPFPASEPLWLHCPQ